VAPVAPTASHGDVADDRPSPRLHHPAAAGGAAAGGAAAAAAAHDDTDVSASYAALAAAGYMVPGIKWEDNNCFIAATLAALAAAPGVRTFLAEHRRTCRRLEGGGAVRPCLVTLLADFMGKYREGDGSAAGGDGTQTAVSMPRALRDALLAELKSRRGVQEDAVELAEVLLAAVNDAVVVCNLHAGHTYTPTGEARVPAPGAGLPPLLPRLDAFSGARIKTMTCGTCGIANDTVASLVSVLPCPVRLEDGTPVTTVADGLRAYATTEVVQADYMSDACGHRGNATAVVGLSQVPPVTIAHVKRFKYGATAQATTKSKQRVTFANQMDAWPLVCLTQQQVQDVAAGAGAADALPAGGADAPALVAGMALPSWLRDVAPLTMDAIALIEHVGGALSGHYITYLRRFVDGAWFWMRCDGSSVEVVTDAAVHAREVYAVVYAATHSTTMRTIQSMARSAPAVRRVVPDALIPAAKPVAAGKGAGGAGRKGSSAAPTAGATKGAPAAAVPGGGGGDDKSAQQHQQQQRSGAGAAAPAAAVPSARQPPPPRARPVEGAPPLPLASSFIPVLDHIPKSVAVEHLTADPSRMRWARDAPARASPPAPLVHAPNINAFSPPANVVVGVSGVAIGVGDSISGGTPGRQRIAPAPGASPVAQAPDDGDSSAADDDAFGSFLKHQRVSDAASNPAASACSTPDTFQSFAAAAAAAAATAAPATAVGTQPMPSRAAAAALVTSSSTVNSSSVVFNVHELDAERQVPPGLVQADNNCFLNTTLVCLAATPGVPEFASEHRAACPFAHDGTDGGRCFLGELADFFDVYRMGGSADASNCDASDCVAVEVPAVLQEALSSGYIKLQHHLQEDAVEMLEFTINLINETVIACNVASGHKYTPAGEACVPAPGAGLPPLLPRLDAFSGARIKTMTCGTCGHAGDTVASLVSVLPCPVRLEDGTPVTTVADGLRAYATTERDQADYRCDTCNTVGSCTTTAGLAAPPSALAAQLTRFTVDPTTQTVTKSNQLVTFANKLDVWPAVCLTQLQVDDLADLRERDIAAVDNVSGIRIRLHNTEPPLYPKVYELVDAKPQRRKLRTWVTKELRRRALAAAAAKGITAAQFKARELAAKTRKWAARQRKRLAARGKALWIFRSVREAVAVLLPQYRAAKAARATGDEAGSAGAASGNDSGSAGPTRDGSTARSGDSNDGLTGAAALVPGDAVPATLRAAAPLQLHAYAMTEHTGSTLGGHYVVYIRQSKAGDGWSWFKCDGPSVSVVDDVHVHSRQPYAVLYTVDDGASARTVAALAESAPYVRRAVPDALLSPLSGRSSTTSESEAPPSDYESDTVKSDNSKDSDFVVVSVTSSDDGQSGDSSSLVATSSCSGSSTTSDDVYSDSTASTRPRKKTTKRRTKGISGRAARGAAVVRRGRRQASGKPAVRPSRAAAAGASSGAESQSPPSAPPAPSGPTGVASLAAIGGGALEATAAASSVLPLSTQATVRLPCVAPADATPPASTLARLQAAAEAAAAVVPLRTTIPEPPPASTRAPAGTPVLLPAPPPTTDLPPMYRVDAAALTQPVQAFLSKLGAGAAQSTAPYAPAAGLVAGLQGCQPAPLPAGFNFEAALCEMHTLHGGDASLSRAHKLIAVRATQLQQDLAAWVTLGILPWLSTTYYGGDVRLDLAYLREVYRLLPPTSPLHERLARAAFGHLPSEQLAALLELLRTNRDAYIVSATWSVFVNNGFTADYLRSRCISTASSDGAGVARDDLERAEAILVQVPSEAVARGLKTAGGRAVTVFTIKRAGEAILAYISGDVHGSLAQGAHVFINGVPTASADGWVYLASRSGPTGGNVNDCFPRLTAALLGVVACRSLNDTACGVAIGMYYGTSAARRVHVSTESDANDDADADADEAEVLPAGTDQRGGDTELAPDANDDEDDEGADTTDEAAQLPADADQRDGDSEVALGTNDDADASFEAADFAMAPPPPPPPPPPPVAAAPALATSPTVASFMAALPQFTPTKKQAAVLVRYAQMASSTRALEFATRVLNIAVDNDDPLVTMLAGGACAVREACRALPPDHPAVTAALVFDLSADLPLGRQAALGAPLLYRSLNAAAVTGTWVAVCVGSFSTLVKAGADAEELEARVTSGGGPSNPRDDVRHAKALLAALSLPAADASGLQPALFYTPSFVRACFDGDATSVLPLGLAARNFLRQLIRVIDAWGRLTFGTRVWRRIRICIIRLILAILGRILCAWKHDRACRVSLGRFLELGVVRRALEVVRLDCVPDDTVGGLFTPADVRVYATISACKFIQRFFYGQLPNYAGNGGASVYAPAGPFYVGRDGDGRMMIARLLGAEGSGGSGGGDADVDEDDLATSCAWAVEFVLATTALRFNNARWRLLDLDNVHDAATAIDRSWCPPPLRERRWRVSVVSQVAPLSASAPFHEHEWFVGTTRELTMVCGRLGGARAGKAPQLRHRGRHRHSRRLHGGNVFLRRHYEAGRDW
jgi:ubiquitin C-terminal hydrolase